MVYPLSVTYNQSYIKSLDLLVFINRTENVSAFELRIKNVLLIVSINNFPGVSEPAQW